MEKAKLTSILGTLCYLAHQRAPFPQLHRSSTQPREVSRRCAWETKNLSFASVQGPAEHDIV